MPDTIVAVTGVTGFLGAHTTIQLLNRGYHVRGTLRNMERAEHIRTIIARHTEHVDRLSFFEIDLLDSVQQWEIAFADVAQVVHIASPFPTRLPKNENDLIEPARTGTLHVLGAATSLGIQRVVLTSSIGAVMYGHRKRGVFSEQDWTNVANKKDTTAYFRSKTIAEQSAWEFVKTTPNAPELVTILPGAILGPVLDGKDHGTSANIVKKMMDGSLPAIPKIGYPMVDVRSVADAHILALEHPQAAGNRYLCTNGYLEFQEVAGILQREFPTRKIPSMQLPDFVVRLFSYIDPETAPVLNDLGAKREMDTAKIDTQLGWQPIDLDASVRATAQSLIDLGVLS